MTLNKNRKLILPILVGVALTTAAQVWAGGFFGGLFEVWGPRYTYAGDAEDQMRWSQPPPPICGNAANSVRRWNHVALDANAIDHTPPAPGESRIFGEQLGPARTSLAFAIIHIAIFEAVNAIAGGFQSYTGLEPAGPETSMDAAVAQAAHDTLAATFPSQTTRFDALLAEDLNVIPDGAAKDNGIYVGQRAAAGILALRAYDGTPGLGTPPRLYNQIAVQIAGQMDSDVVQLARLLALVNVALADSAIACWETKYYFQFWRPITAIRESDLGTGPTGAGDGNLLT